MDGLANDNIGALILCAVFVALAIVEVCWPERAPPEAVGRRWFGNISLGLMSSGLTMLPMLAGVGTAWVASAQFIGLLNWLTLPTPVHIAVALLALDALMYGLHWASHMVGPLWRLHAVHHSDPEIDVTTTLRHHPLEAAIIAAMVGTTVYLLGITPTEIAAYGAMAWMIQTLAHTNMALPVGLDAMLRHVIVTPKFHQIHHSRVQRETDTNYGEVLVIWDRLFRTACRRQHDMAPIAFGLDAFRGVKFQAPLWLLVQPFLTRK